ncbi:MULTISPECIES: DedA family protein/thiosulfate sulfurtransferase GlpE [unclassified Luteibacter]|uniref:DedA family protein/thiosulfate sulfurtransferase GlpE n=1 Tax=unclassified Luteibacter TaxID=2620188 RepID=UPI0008D4607B|nr:MULTISPECIES: DedA family protein/thiosulfate sulfurtransferase GlpE [unclassified Luteibacter]MDR6938434.1 membrane protein DedA with SNARE-associated domain/rhodanese-related sulfurtransferase [Luteibacter sp. 3190]SEP10521.1 membrane protein DedA, SNARE-associated domain [Luteibacter sp. UNC138MFCol5.1]SEW05172.1 membrane protein DedA, SNARE-associated domain [Luteibacter sp. 329MFSha]
MASINWSDTAPIVAFVGVFAGAVGLPVPAMPTLIVVGSTLVAARDPLLIIGTFVAALAGAFLGDAAWFLTGRRFGYRVLDGLCRISLSPDTCVRRASGFFEKRGVKLLLVSRFIPGLSLVAIPIAGASDTRFSRFTVYDLLGAALWISVGLSAGMLFYRQIDAVLAILRQFGIGLAAAGLIALALWIVFRYVRRTVLIMRLRKTRISVDELSMLLASEPGALIVDVRSAMSRRDDPFVIPGSKLFDLATADVELATLPRHSSVVIYCSCPNEVSAAKVAERLSKLGFANVRPLTGGLGAWREAGGDVEAIVVAT